MVMIYTRKTHKFNVQRSVGSKDRVETNGGIDGRTDRRTILIALASWLTRSVKFAKLITLVQLFC